MKKGLISVVITTKNEAKNIINCLNSIKKESYPKNLIEVIVVDNNSKDETKKIVRKFKKKNKEIKLNLYNFGPERSAQRNYGADKANGEYYIYLDADMILSRHVFVESVEKYNKTKDLKGLYIPEIILGKSFWSRVRRFERSFYNGTVIDCVRFVKLIEFRKIKGFDESMSGPEDWDFDKKIRIRGKVDIIKSSIYHNETNFNLKSYLSKKQYYSKSLKTYIEKWGENDADIKKQLGLYYRFIGVFFEKENWKKILMNPILGLSMLFLKLLIGCVYVKVKFSKL